jgi:hypothetical protein
MGTPPAAKTITSQLSIGLVTPLTPIDDVDNDTLSESYSASPPDVLSQIDTPVASPPSHDKKFARFSRITVRNEPPTSSLSSFDLINSYQLKKIRQIDSSRLHPNRSGVIVYTVHNDNIYFCLGIDSSSGDLTDLGGGINRNDRNPVQGGLREFMEESLLSFGVITEDDIQEQNVAYSSDMMVIFIHVEVDVESLLYTFSRRYQTSRNPEISGILWVSLAEFKSLISSGYMYCENDRRRIRRRLYDRLQKFLQNVSTVHNLFDIL